MAEPKHILAITACPSGVAHTYMAAERLEQAAKELGYTIDVETHGQIGVENEFSAEAVERAAAVVIAADKQVDTTRFVGKPLTESNVMAGINDPHALIERALAAAPMKGVRTAEKTASQEKTSPVRYAYNALMNGVSHMIPFVVAGGIMLALAFTLGGDLTQEGLVVPEGTFWYTVMNIGSLAFSLMVPILSGYIAYAIADRPGLAPGLITGMLAVSPELYGSEASAGFLGGIITGFMAGFVALAIKKVKVPKALSSVMPIIVIPLFTTVIVGLLFVYVLGAPISATFDALNAWLAGLQGANLALLGIILGAMIAFDMGGPVNKVAFLFAGGLIASGQTVPMGIVGVAIAVPPLGMGLATLIRRAYFTPAERNNGIAALLTGSLGITEGAIPFAGARPLQVIPANMIGGAVGGAIAGMLHVENMAMWGGLIMPALGASTTPFLYVAATLAGALVTCFVSLTLIGVSKRPSTNSSQDLTHSVDVPVGTEAADVPETSASALAAAPVVGGAAVATATAVAPTPARTRKKVDLLDYLQDNNIHLSLEVADRDEAIAALTKQAASSGWITDAEAVVDAALEREEIGTTAVGNGIAIPHAKTDAVTSASLAFGRFLEPLDWGAADGQPVDMAFLVSVPESSTGNEHLKIIASLSRHLAKPDFREELRAAGTRADVLGIMARI